MEYLCGLEEHTHTEECYDPDGNLLCGLEEHTHSDSCRSSIAPMAVIRPGDTPENPIELTVGVVNTNQVIASRDVYYAFTAPCKHGYTFQAEFDETYSPDLLFTSESGEILGDAGTLSGSHTKGSLTLEEGQTVIIQLYSRNTTDFMTLDARFTVSYAAGAHFYDENGQCGCGEQVSGGFCGAKGDGRNLTWKMEGSTLVISGEGEMKSFNRNNIPWPKQSIDSIRIEEGVTTIGTYAFYGMSKVTHVQLPESLTTIGNYAFQTTGDITNLVIPAGVTSLGTSAFESSGIQEITFSEGQLTTIGDSCFKRCIQLTQITLPDSVTKIGRDAFYSCGQLKKLELPGSLSTIPQNLANSSTLLNEVTIPESVTKIEASALWSMKEGSTIHWDAADVASMADRSVKFTRAHVILGTTVDNLSSEIFSAMVQGGLQDLTILPENRLTLPEISGFGFRRALPAGTYHVDAQGVYYRIEDGEAHLAYIPDGITEYTVPASLAGFQEGEEEIPVTGVGSNVCGGELESLTFDAPGQITTIAPFAFANGEQLGSINGETTQDDVETLFQSAEIGVQAFYNTPWRGSPRARRMGISSLKRRISRSPSRPTKALITLPYRRKRRLLLLDRRKIQNLPGDLKPRQLRSYGGRRDPRLLPV